MIRYVAPVMMFILFYSQQEFSHKQKLNITKKESVFLEKF